MVAPLAMAPVSSGAAATNYRPRSTAGESTILPGSAAKPSAGEEAGDRQSLPFEKKQQSANGEPERSRSADFAAAVIAGALSPTPQSMDELIRRIGISEIPEESQARLRDIIA